MVHGHSWVLGEGDAMLGCAILGFEFLTNNFGHYHGSAFHAIKIFHKQILWLKMLTSIESHMGDTTTGNSTYSISR